MRRRPRPGRPQPPLPAPALPLTGIAWLKCQLLLPSARYARSRRSSRGDTQGGI